MGSELFIILLILFLICMILIIKIYSMKKSINNIEKSLENILKMDTNNLITVSDKSVRNLAIFLNKQLRELRKQRLLYENGNEELKRNITNISHDLRTPITVIKGYLDLLREEKLSEQEEKYLKIIYNKSEELTELTEQLFDFSKTIDTNNIELKKEKCCINELVENILASYYPIFKEKNIIPEISICKEKIYRIVNKSSVIRIFENIISNVIKYSDGSFKIKIYSDGNIIISNKATSLDTTSVNKIFDRYFSVENAKESTGIGLSIAKNLVEINNGNIVAEYKNNILTIKINFSQM